MCANSFNGIPSIKYAQFQDIEEALVYDAVLNDLDNTEYLILLRSIRDCLNEYKSFACSAEWKSAIQNAKNYNLISSNTFAIRGTLRDSYPRAFDVAKAARGLENLGCKIELEQCSLSIKEGMDEVVETLENCISDIGGISVIRLLFNHMTGEGRYFRKLNRFLVLPSLNFDPRQAKPMIPFGYLLNLSAKYPYENLKHKNNPREVQKKLDYIISVSTLLSTVLDVRAYSTFENFFQSSDTLPAYIRNIALYDATFAFPSADITEIPHQIQELFSWITPLDFENQFSFSIADYIFVVETIIDIGKERVGPIEIYLSALEKRLTTLSTERIKEILKQMSHEDRVNENYRFVTDYVNCDFGFKPLIKISDTKYFLLDKSWSATAFYELIAAQARLIDQENVESKIGECLETFVQNAFHDKGIIIHSGNYVGANKGKGECDVLIESTEAIVLIEIKKKVLTRKAKAGFDTGIIIDLTSSLLDAQLQAGRTELILRNQGFIELKSKNGDVSKIELNDRKIERVTLTHLDFGSFQDRNVINNILSVLVNTNVEPLDKEDEILKSKFEIIRKKSDAWRHQADELSKVDEGFDHFPFFNCWFLSLSQMLLVLKHSTDNESFYTTLKKSKHVTLGSSNFYYEFLVNKGLKVG
jgi:hypothetical protein